MAVVVLEASEAPVSLYDIQRGMIREFGWSPERMSLNATVALDPRCCWAGRGLYGLWRHGLVPGPRKLEDVARLVLYSYPQKPLDQDELGFVLRHLGYRFQQASLYNAVRTSAYIDDLYGWTWLGYDVDRDPAYAAQLMADLGLSPEAFQAVIERVGAGVIAGLAERRHRLVSERGLSNDDPVYEEGTLRAPGVY
jgi:hypothetical protein